MIIQDSSLLSLNDICVIPAPITNIKSRSECDPYNSKGSLPLVTSPMSCVIDENNWEKFDSEGIMTVIPRTVPLTTRVELMAKTFVSLSLKEFEELFCSEATSNSILLELCQNDIKAKVCIDIANGHMGFLIDLCKAAKEKFKDKLVIMTGNIANPSTYIEYAKAGIDYVRVGIGTGSRCTTSANVGIHFPMASLLDYIQETRATSALPSYPKIIADGGFDNYDAIIKALALGADYVMCGKLFAECQEACGKTYIIHNPDGSYKGIERDYYGMSTKIAQAELGKATLRTSEGISKKVTVKYPLKTFVDNFKDYLTSAMSYCNARNLKEFTRAIKCRISTEARTAYFK